MCKSCSGTRIVTQFGPLLLLPHAMTLWIRRLPAFRRTLPVDSFRLFILFRINEIRYRTERLTSIKRDLIA